MPKYAVLGTLELDVTARDQDKAVTKFIEKVDANVAPNSWDIAVTEVGDGTFASLRDQSILLDALDVLEGVDATSIESISHEELAATRTVIEAIIDHIQATVGTDRPRQDT